MTTSNFTANQLSQKYELYMDGFKTTQTGTLSYFINVWGINAVNSFLNNTGHWMTTFRAL